MTRYLIVTAALVALGRPVFAADRSLPFRDAGWELQGSATRVVRDDGRDVLEVETGFAYRRDVRFQDGRIDFDVQLTRRRSFIYCFFRMADDDEHEEVYLRPHKSGLGDAVQYAPVFQGRSGWQLYHGPGKTAAVAFEPGAWTHVRLLFAGTHAALFVGAMDTPVLVMRLARPPGPGYLALGGFLPAGVPGTGPIARFANVVVDAAPPAYDFGAHMPPEPQPVPGIVRAWAVSPYFPPAEPTGVPVVPEAGPAKVVAADPGGLVELHHAVQIPEKVRSWAALARLHVTAASAGTYAFDLGYSDVATVFLNGRPVFRGDSTYSYDNPRREGLIGLDQARLYLPLAAGDNELAVVVSDVFGGWGIMGRFVAPRGLTVDAR